MVIARNILKSLNNIENFICDYRFIYGYNPYISLENMNMVDVLYNTSTMIIKNDDPFVLQQLYSMIYKYPVYQAVDILLDVVENITCRSISRISDKYCYINIDKDEYLYRKYSTARINIP